MVEAMGKLSVLPTLAQADLGNGGRGYAKPIGKHQSKSARPFGLADKTDIFFRQFAKMVLFPAIKSAVFEFVGLVFNVGGPPKIGHRIVSFVAVTMRSYA